MTRAALAVVLLLAPAAPDALAQYIVSGTALDAAGAPLNDAVRLVAAGRLTKVPSKPITTTVASNGIFVFTNVPPGEYRVQAFVTRGPGRPAEFGVEQVSVTDRDPGSITIRTSAGAVLEGLIMVEDQPQWRAATVTLLVAPFDADRAPGTEQNTLAVYSDGRFYLTGLYGRARLALATVPKEWYFKSVTIDGVDATHRGFDFGVAERTFRDALIQIAHATGVVSGRVASESGTRAGDCAVILFATDPEKWFATSGYLRRAPCAPDGSFRVDGLPPGDYHVAAVDLNETVESGSWQEPAALQALRAAARRVTVGEGAPSVLELGPIRARAIALP